MATTRPLIRSLPKSPSGSTGCSPWLSRFMVFTADPASRLPPAPLQQLHQIPLLLLHLIHRALLRRFVGPPAQQARAVAETVAREVVVADLDHELRLERHPFAGTFGRPAAPAARLVAGEAGLPDQLFELFGQRRLFARLDGGGEADMGEQGRPVIEPEQQRAHDLLAFVVAEAADPAVGAAIILDLLHAAAVAGRIGDVAALGDDAVERRADPLEPAFRLGEPHGGGREAETLGSRELPGGEIFQS